MGKSKTYKCKYSHCKHDTRDIPSDEAVKVGKSAYYHEDCRREMELIKEIIDIFYVKVDNNVVMPRLRKVLNNIIYNKNVSPEYLLFGINYFLKNKTLNYPEGLYYVASDSDVKSAWDKMIKKKISESAKDEFTVKDEDLNTSPSFTINQKQKSFSDILGG